MHSDFMNFIIETEGREWFIDHHQYFYHAPTPPCSVAENADRFFEFMTGRYTRSKFYEMCTYFGGKCLACGLRPLDIHSSRGFSASSSLAADHVHPRSKAGSDNMENRQPLCGYCNSSKGAHYVEYRPFHVLLAIDAYLLGK